MKHKFLFVALLGIAIASCTSSCHSCAAVQPIQSSDVVSSSASVGASTQSTQLAGGGETGSLVGQGGECLSVNGIIQCGSSMSQDSVSTAASTVQATPDRMEPISSDNWQIMLPTSFKEKSAVQKNVVLSRLDQNDNLLVVMLKESYSSNYDQYILGAVRAFREGGASVISSETVTLNSDKFTQIQVLKGNVTIWNWLTHKNNFGYILSCGGPSASETSRQVCGKIADSLKIN